MIERTFVESRIYRRDRGERGNDPSKVLKIFSALSVSSVVKSLFFGSVTYGFLILSLAGCASVQTAQEWDRVKNFSVERTGAETRWERSEDDEKATQAEVIRLLSDGLTENDAVTTALLNNRELQAAFEKIGIAKSDLVQAGLFTNPDLSAVFRFPVGGGGTNIGADATMNIADFWQVPLRKKVAATRLETAILRVSEQILNTVAEARHAHLDCVALSEMREEAVNIRLVMEAFRDHLRYRREFGFTLETDILEANAAILSQEAEIARTEKELQVARAHLNRVLGLSSNQADYKVIGTLSLEFPPLPDLETIIASSFLLRPDIQIAQVKVEDSRRVLELEQKRIVRNVQAGLSYDRETEGIDLFGPRLGVQLPLFDQNQAQISRARYRMRQAEKELQAKMGSVREEVSTALERLSLAREEASLVRDQILPARAAAVEYAEKYFNAMQLSMLYLLESRRKLSEARFRLTEVLRELRKQEIELERVSGGRWG